MVIVEQQKKIRNTKALSQGQSSIQWKIDPVLISFFSWVYVLKGYTRTSSTQYRKYRARSALSTHDLLPRGSLSSVLKSSMCHIYLIFLTDCIRLEGTGSIVEIFDFPKHLLKKCEQMTSTNVVQAALRN